ncbi:MAG: RNA polymerase sigma factor [Pseudomonadota bacterium]
MIEQGIAAQPQALEALLTEHESVIRAAISRHCPRWLSAEVDDIFQEVRRRLWVALKNERKLERPASYLYRTAVTATIDAIRRSDARPEITMDTELDTIAAEPSSPAAGGSPEQLMGTAELLGRVSSCLAQVATRRREAVKLHLLGMTTREIAAVHNWTEPKARNLVYRGLKDLRTVLAAEGIEYEAD